MSESFISEYWAQVSYTRLRLNNLKFCLSVQKQLDSFQKERAVHISETIPGSKLNHSSSFLAVPRCLLLLRK